MTTANPRATIVAPNGSSNPYSFWGQESLGSHAQNFFAPLNLIKGNQTMRKPWPAGQIFACALRDELVARVLGADRDPDAINLLVKALPRDLPSNIRRAARDKDLRKLAAELRGGLPGVTDHRIANLLAEAGRRVGQGSPLAGPPFGGLTRDELTELKAKIGRVLRWAPARQDGSQWPKLRQMLAIIR